jgi:hypothetical protein
VFEQLQSNDLVVVSSSESRVFAECKTLPASPLRRRRSQGPHCHTHCSHRLSKSVSPPCLVAALHYTREPSHRQGGKPLHRSPCNPPTRLRTCTSTATGILRGRDCTSAPPDTQGAARRPFRGCPALRPTPVGPSGIRPPRTGAPTGHWAPGTVP